MFILSFISTAKTKTIFPTLPALPALPALPEHTRTFLPYVHIYCNTHSPYCTQSIYDIDTDTSPFYHYTSY